jgi:signal transduction histidine kinase
MKPFARHVLILTPFGRDALTMEKLLQGRNIDTTIMASFDQLVGQIDAYTGAVLLTDESLAGQDLASLEAKLRTQPSWSDLPFIMLTRRERMDAAHQKRLQGSLPRRMSNIVFVERPASALALTSAVEAALSGRERQFEIRDELRAAVLMNERLSEAEATLARSHQELEKLVEERTAALRDSHERLRAEAEERRRAEEALAHAQKMEAVGRLTGGIAHDFNNLLMALLGNLELARRHLDSGSPVLSYIDKAYKATQRGAKLSAQLLAFSRIQKLALESVNIDGLIGNVVDLARHSLGAMHGIELKLDAPGSFARADANQLELAVLNLVNNARDAMEDGGTVTLSTGLHPIVDLDPDLAPGSYVEICVTDSGTGISPDALKRIFDPFFTTKPLGKGTGLGLAQVWGIARQCGGTVRVTTSMGRGTTFSLLLPLAAQSEELAATETVTLDAVDGNAGQGTSVLVIDDDDNVRESIVAGLTLEEFEVREAKSGEAGLALIGADFPDVLLVDFAMPNMNGADVARAAQKIRPGLPVLMVTGYLDTAALDGVSNAQILHKPLPLEALGRMIVNLAGGSQSA